jgi:hypothetical protein
VSAVQLPTLPDCADGIVGWDPVVLQCRECGVLHEGDPKRRPAMVIILARFLFHRCDDEPVRRCPDCYAKAVADCPNGWCKR